MRGSWEGRVCVLKDSRSSLVLGDSMVGTSLWVLVCSASHRALVPQGLRKMAGCSLGSTGKEGNKQYGEEIYSPTQATEDLPRKALRPVTLSGACYKVKLWGPLIKNC